MRRFANLRSYLLISLIAGLFVGVLVYFGTDNLTTALIWSLLTFIISVVTVATLDLSFKPDQGDPNRPKLR